MLANNPIIHASLLIVFSCNLIACSSSPEKPAAKQGKPLHIKTLDAMTIEDVTNYHSAAGHAIFLRDTVYEITSSCIAAHGPLNEKLTASRSDWEVINGPYTELGIELDARAMQKIEQEGGLASAKQFRLDASNLLKNQIQQKIDQLQKGTGQRGYTDEFCIRMGQALDRGNFNVDPKQFEFLYQ